MQDGVIGRINSINTAGTVDGPGVRFVVFMQGCALRCRYCHNPDTWELDDGEQCTPEQIMKKLLPLKPFYKNGGITVSGGEPLLQCDFVTELFKLCRQQGIHTALDTAGIRLNDKAKHLLEYTDLVLLDVKFADAEDYVKHTSADVFNAVNSFLDYLESIQKPTYVSHVVVPGINDSEEYIKKLCGIIKPKKCVKKLRLLGFKNLCIEKYRRLGIPFGCEGVEPMPQDRLEQLKSFADSILYSAD